MKQKSASVSKQSSKKLIGTYRVDEKHEPVDSSVLASKPGQDFFDDMFETKLSVSKEIGKGSHCCKLEPHLACPESNTEAITKAENSILRKDVAPAASAPPVENRTIIAGRSQNTA